MGPGGNGLRSCPPLLCLEDGREQLVGEGGPPGWAGGSGLREAGAQGAGGDAVMLGSRSGGAVHPWVLPAHLVHSHPTQTCGVGVGKAGAGWLSLASAHRKTNPKLRAVLAAPGPQPLLLLTLHQHLSTLLGLLLVPFATRGTSHATLCGISWQLGTPRLPTPCRYWPASCRGRGGKGSASWHPEGGREGASGKAAPGAPVIPKPGHHCALQSGLCARNEAPQLGQ